MNCTILKETTNPLLGRKEMVLKCKNPQKSTPTKVDVLKEVSIFLKKDQDTIAVKKIAQEFGVDSCKVEVFVYNKKEDKEQIETINKKKAKKGEESDKEKPEAPAEKPKEAPKEEQKPEEKKE